MPLLDVGIKDEQNMSPGFIFWAPYRTQTPGPYIYDNNGVRPCSFNDCRIFADNRQELVWSGSDGSATDLFHDLHVCSYANTDHLCYFKGAQIGGYARGSNIILDSSYKLAATVQSGNNLEMSDLHELNIPNAETALIPIYQPRQYDLVPYGVPAGDGWVMDGVFQEINITSGAVLFQWASLDHVPLAETYVPLGLNPIVGNGTSNTTAWDYFHLNSIKRSDGGDYLISSRHTSTIYKVSGHDGSLIWRLGGKQSSFALLDYNFSSQHDAEFLQTNDTHTILSLFDNGSDDYRNTSSTSAGMIVSLDHRTNTSNILKRFEAPGEGLRSSSQGNMQVLPNGNTFIGWGSNPYVSEHAPNGTVIYFAGLKDKQAMNYRAFRGTWKATPSTPPSLFAQASSPNGPVTFWASWNGATDYSSWNFYGRKSASDSMELLGSVPRQGFQTAFTSTQFFSHALAEAISGDGSSLGNSTVTSVALT